MKEISAEDDLPVDMATSASSGSPSSLNLLVLLKGSEPEGLGRAETVSYQLETAITMGILAEGDRLPRESVLASELGISPLTLRQSLATLRTKGLIETSRGRSGGSFVIGTSGISDTEVRQKLRRTSTEDIRDLGDYCTAIATLSAKLAAERADERDIHYLAGLTDGFRKSSGPQEIRRFDSKFHITISVAAQSSRLTAAMLQIQAELSGFIWATQEYGFSVAHASAQHDQILDGIKRRDPEAAASAAEAHTRSEMEMLVGQHLQLLVQQEEKK